MNGIENNNFSFENDFINHISYIKEFTTEIYEEYDLIANKIDLNTKIDDLFNGKKVNLTENLAAFHPKYRNDYNENEDSINAISQYKNFFNNAKNIVSIGIGGSFEGPKLLIESIGVTSENFIFVTGSDSEEFKEKIFSLKPTETVFIVSSKSFTTDETLNILSDAIKWSGDMNRFLAITANKNEALKYKIPNIIEFDKEIGGRYSIWSDISFAAHFANEVELKEKFILGGKQADQDLKNDKKYFKFIKNLSFSDVWLHNHKNKFNRVILSYIWKFRSLPSYFQQLEMESLGKHPANKSKFSKTGQIIFGGYGPTAQHSYFQLLHQGTHDLCADIITSDEDVNSLSYVQAITQARLLSSGSEDPLKQEEIINGNIPINLIILKRIDSFTLGYLVATWEHRTFITASILGINPFDQFGVNAGKFYTKKYFSLKD